MNVNRIDGELNAAGARFGIVLARFNAFIGERLLEGALQALTHCGADAGSIDVVRVPGAYELPLAAKAMGASGHYDAIIALGAVIRGQTPHFEYVAGECARGLAQVALEADLPVAFGVLTVDNVRQALERAGAWTGDPVMEDAVHDKKGAKGNRKRVQQKPKPKKRKSDNKGADAAMAAIEMVNLLKKLRG